MVTARSSADPPRCVSIWQSVHSAYGKQVSLMCATLYDDVLVFTERCVTQPFTKSVHDVSLGLLVASVSDLFHYKWSKYGALQIRYRTNKLTNKPSPYDTLPFSEPQFRCPVQCSISYGNDKGSRPAGFSRPSNTSAIALPVSSPPNQLCKSVVALSTQGKAHVEP